ncbi:type I restriction endonuclease [Yersinia aleksiciae]|uniref:type I restriction endonuclease n=1 Tax=Yersinia aleksiciae TaxID=263819 RepID=UPI001427AFCF|nr:type I restriction endonuclease [Yersinia aleksiciae]MDA5496472.1 type I restriction endonuclease [Yersinia aleksiciae]NIK97771.1 type I restriction endonuclease subunit R [Yersinia aleksiciae]WQC69523.1 type I restriction endonuclease [Yersinia aleksiciae]
MKIFAEKLRTHSDHVKKVSHHCSTEETTKQALILPMLDILGFNSYDPTKVKAEYGADFPGVKVGERVDYALFCHGVPVMFIEAKGYNQKLDNHCPQLSRYFNATPEVTIAAITNGTQWRFFTDLKQRNIMDASPFLQIDVDEASDSDAHQLYQFRHDQFQPEALRTLAEESIYLSAFTDVISDSLRNVDSDFVRYVASRSSVQRQLNQKFLDTITPLVKMAVERAVSAMVVSGLSMASNKEKEIDATPISELTQTNDTAPVIDSENPNIVTTHNERLFYSNIELLLGEGADLSAKDTASYYNILYQGKSNRWVVRYFDSKQRPSIILPIELDEKAVAEVERAGLELAPGNQIIIDRPENILRLSGLISDSYNYCVDDDNFRNKKK